VVVKIGEIEAESESDSELKLTREGGERKDEDTVDAVKQKLKNGLMKLAELKVNGKSFRLGTG
jgi:hypothetical protein